MKYSEKHLENILIEVGEFGRYQQRILIICMLIMGVIYFPNVIYIFEAKAVNHRCAIPGCENETSSYLTDWLTNAVPFKGDKPERCIRYQRLHNENFSCLISDFNQSVREDCHDFIYETTEISIVHDYDLHCDENVKKLTFVGTLNGIGKFIGVPIAGYISDRYGRKQTLLWSMIIGGLCGLLRSISASYEAFMAFEFFESFFVSGSYISVFVLAVELVGFKKRPLANMLLNTSFGIGNVVLTHVAWLLNSWRWLLRAVYGFVMFGAVSNWFVPESLRWLLACNKTDDVENLVKNIAKVNKKSVGYSSLKKLVDNVNDGSETVYPLREFLNSYKLVTRCIFCSFCWISTIFTYYGLSVISVTFSTNFYLDFIFNSLIEFPACLTTYFVIDRMGSKKNLLIGYILSCLFSVVLIFIPIDNYWINLTLFLIGKYGISLTGYTIYLITSEMFPTSLRQTSLAICSMFGRLGNIVAPQLILLKNIWKHFPFVMFAVCTGISALLTTTFPDTKDIILPDSVMEAESIGQKKIENVEDIDL